MDIEVVTPKKQEKMEEETEEADKKGEKEKNGEMPKKEKKELRQDVLEIKGKSKRIKMNLNFDLIDSLSVDQDLGQSQLQSLASSKDEIIL